MKNEFMTRGQIADYVGCCSRTIKRWVDAGKFPAPAINVTAQFQRWRRSDVEEFLGQSTPQVEAESKTEVEV